MAKDYASLLLICRDEAIFALQTRTPAFDRFYKTLIDTIPLKNVTSRFAMERIKSTTAYKVPELPRV